MGLLNSAEHGLGEEIVFKLSRRLDAAFENRCVRARAMALARVTSMTITYTLGRSLYVALTNSPNSSMVEVNSL